MELVPFGSVKIIVFKLMHSFFDINTSGPMIIKSFSEHKLKTVASDWSKASSVSN